MLLLCALQGDEDARGFFFVKATLFLRKARTTPFGRFWRREINDRSLDPGRRRRGDIYLLECGEKAWKKGLGIELFYVSLKIDGIRVSKIF